MAISEVTGKTVDEVNEAINKSKSGGKEKLNKIFEGLGLSKPDGTTKELLALRMETIPEEVSEIVNKIKDTINK